MKNQDKFLSVCGALLLAGGFYLLSNRHSNVPSNQVAMDPVTTETQAGEQVGTATATAATFPGVQAKLSVPDQLTREERQAYLYDLIATNPEQAYQTIQTNHANAQVENSDVEKPFVGTGAILVQITCGTTTGDSVTSTFTPANSTQTYEAYSWGDRLDAGSDPNALVVGYTVGNRIVMHPTATVANKADFVEQAQMTGALTSGEILATFGSVVSSTPTSLTMGSQTILYIRARFADEPSTFEPVSQATAITQLDKTVEHFLLSSYGKLSLSYTAVPTVVTLPKTAALSVYSSTSFAALVADASAAAKALNPAWDAAHFGHVIVVTSDKPNYPYVGVAAIGGTSVHAVAPECDLRTLGHELGHNFGLYHANFWNTGATAANGKTVGGATNSEIVEYGHRFSLMGGQNEPSFNDSLLPQFSGREKYKLGWLTNTEVGIVTASGTYRLYALDAAASGVRTAKIDRVTGDTSGAQRKYWLNFRSLFFTETPSPYDQLRGSYAPYGIQLDWASDTYGNLAKSVLNLDTTPKSQLPGQHTGHMKLTPDQTDGVIMLGRTYSDPASRIHITPVNVDPAGLYIDVRIALDPTPSVLTADLTSSAIKANLGAPVTFSLAASSSAGSIPLYRSWEFGDSNLSVSQLNAITVTRSWTTAGIYTVTGTVSDGMGGTAQRKVVVTVGSPVTGVVSGRILRGGSPEKGVMVRLNGAQTAWTLDDGSYTISDVPAGSYTLAAYRDGSTFTSQFTQPINVLYTGSSNGNDFHLGGTSASGVTSYSVTGKLTSIISGSLSTTEVVLGGRSVKADSAGNFTFPNITPGAYTLRVNSPDTYLPATQQVTVTTAPVAGLVFQREAYTFAGSVLGLTSAIKPSVRLSNLSYYPATLVWNGTTAAWDFTFKVPSGTWVVGVSVAGYSIVAPSATVTVSNNATPPVTFLAQAGLVGTVTGYVPYGYRGLGNVTISCAGVSTVTDSYGYFMLANIPVGIQSITATKSGIVFARPTRSVTIIKGGMLGGCNFDLLTPNTKPVFVSLPSASTTSILGTGTPVTLNALAKYSGVESNLKYTWTTTTGVNAFFGTNNGTNAAKTTTVWFQAIGTYTLQCQVSDPNGYTVTATLAVTVLPGTAGYTIRPFEAYGRSGESISYTALRWDQAGVASTASSTWQTTLGYFAGNTLILPSTGHPTDNVSYNLGAEKSALYLLTP